MNSSSVPSIEGVGKRGGLPLRPWLVGLSAPMPTMEAPASLRLAGYRVSAMEGEPPRQGRELSHGALRRFRLEPLSGGAPLVLSLLPAQRHGHRLESSFGMRKVLSLTLLDSDEP